MPASPPDGLSLILFAGDAVLTDAVIGVHKESGALSVLRKAPGDGIVLRTSTLMDERVGGHWSRKLISSIEWSHVMFLATDHLGMTKDPSFNDNILYYLLERPD